LTLVHHKSLVLYKKDTFIVSLKLVKALSS